MQHVDGHLLLSATDLSNHAGCSHLTQQSLRVANGEITAPMRKDIRLEALRERGFAHEAAYLDHLEKTLGIKRSVVDTEERTSVRVEQTRSLMAAGAELIVQAALVSDAWFGYADVLMKVATPSDLGPWSYEVIDTKLARETKGATILQLCLYAELVAAVQGVLPTRVGVVTPLGMELNREPEWYRTLDYMAYVRRVKASLTNALAEPPKTYPEPVDLCDVCRWQSECRGVRRRDDHLSLVAGISTSQRKELVERKIETVRALAEMPLPLPFRPDRGAPESYERIREQARVQVVGRDAKSLYCELLPIHAERGLCRLPEPSQGDLYFDIEGDRYAGRDGMEYLLGVAYEDGGAWQYQPFWGLDAAGEKSAFEAFVAFVEARRVLHPNLHIYHFDHYEPSAIKRLMGRYATCEAQIDDWLRHHLFVDLHQVVRDSVRASVERYGLKEMEAFYEFKRAVPLDVAGNARAWLESAIELSQLADLDADVMPHVEGYNRDDCVSTAQLHRWLEQLRQEQVEAGVDIPRWAPAAAETNEKFDARREHVLRLVAALTHDVPADEDDRTPAQHARWLLAHCLDYYRREDKVEWWEKFRLMDLDPAEYLYENKALGGLVFVGAVEGEGKLPTHRYSYPKQECGIRKGDLLGPDGEKVGELVNIDPNHRTIDIKKTKKTVDLHPIAVFEFSRINVSVLEDALIRIAEWASVNDIDAPGPFRAARDVLLRREPRLSDGIAFAVKPDSLVQDAQRICGHLDHTILPVQGPPGSGKTYLGAELIVDLVRAGKKVGVCANSHKVIRNLLDAVVKSAARNGVEVRCAAKPEEDADLEGSGIAHVADNKTALAAIQHEVHVLGGTKFLWSRLEFMDSVDVLVVDEASQFALADALASLRLSEVCRLSRRPDAARASSERHPSARCRRLAARSRAGPRRDDAGDARHLHPDHTSAASVHLRIHLGGVLRRQALVDARSRTSVASQLRIVRWCGPARGAGNASRQSVIVRRGSGRDR